MFSEGRNAMSLFGVPIESQPHPHKIKKEEKNEREFIRKATGKKDHEV
jgi:hypothetical protein